MKTMAAAMSPRSGRLAWLMAALAAAWLAVPVTAAGLFLGGGARLLLAQLVGVVAVGAFVVVLSALAWGLLKVTVGIRVSADEEREGLDVGEHGISAYPDFHAAASYGSPGVAAGGRSAPATALPAIERAH